MERNFKIKKFYLKGCMKISLKIQPYFKEAKSAGTLLFPQDHNRIIQVTYRMSEMSNLF